jgi:photosystem II stability/assembly factor-like uncharacterized protein
MRYTILLLMSLPALQATAQWEPIFELATNNIYELYALDKTQLFLGAEQGDLYHSSNGGADFTIRDLQEYGFVSTIAFEDDMTGYAGGGCYFPFDECPGNTFYKTTDGGQSWNQLQGDLIFGIFTDIEPMGNGKLYTTNEFTGLHYSEDGGANLSPLFIDNTLDNARYQKIQFINDQTGFVGVINYGANTVISRYIYKTQDGGQTWSNIFQLVGSDYDNIRFFFTDEEQGFALGLGGKIWHTNNGGSTWEEQQYGDASEIGRDIFFPNASTGYIASHAGDFNLGRIYRSTNGGQTWELDLEVDSTFFDNLYFADEENGFAVSDYKTIYRRSGTNAADHTTPANIEIFPNPAVDFIEIIGIAPSVEYQIWISDITGKFIQKTNLYNSKTRIPVGHLANGVYFVKILDKQGNNSGTWKFAKFGP